MIAILTVSHGTSDPLGQRAIQAYAEAIHAAVDADISAHAYVDVQEPDLSTALTSLPRRATVVIVPLLLSRGYHLGHDIPLAAQPFGDRVVIAHALGPDDRLAHVLRRRLREAGVSPTDHIVLAAAGSTDTAGVDDARQAALSLGITLQRPVTVAFLSAAQPVLADAVARHRSADGGRVAVASYLLAPGYFHDRIRATTADTSTPPLLTVDTAPAYELVAIAADRYSAALSVLGAGPRASDPLRARAIDDDTAP